MRSIRLHLSAWVLCAVIVLSILAALFCYVRTRSILAREFDAGLLSRAQSLCALVQRDPNGNLEVASSDALIPEASHVEQTTQFFEIWDAAGAPLRRSTTLNGTELSPPRSSEPITFWDLRLPNGVAGRGVRFEYIPVLEDEPGEKEVPIAIVHDPHERVTLALAEDMRSVRRVERVLLTSIGLAALCLCTGLLVVLPWAVERGLAPLRRVSERAVSIDASRLSERFDTGLMPAELHPICSRLNDLLGRLEEAFLRERRFSADVAHELRTPIAELRTMAEVMTRWPPDAEAGQKAFQDALCIARQMESIVTTLLALGRCEAGKLQLELQPIDLSLSIRRVSEQLKVAAARRNLHFTVETPKTAMIFGDQAIIDAIVTNILSNAVMYCPIDGDVKCTIRPASTHVELLVSNEVDDLSPEDIKHVIEPFWRKDASRSGSDNAGLGLALVEAYAKAIKADLKVSMENGGQFEISLRFPHARGSSALAKTVEMPTA